MKKFYVLLVTCITLILLSCSTEKSDKPLFMATSFPVYILLSELSSGVADVDFIVPTGASPHTYAPKPGDIKKTSKALAVFYVAENFDGWISDVPTNRKIKLIDMVPMDNLIFFSCGHDHSDGSNIEEHTHEVDPHFWSDPLTVKSMINHLTDTLIALYPEGKEIFLKNSTNFSNVLDIIHSDASELMVGLEGKNMFLHHPSFNYLIERYGLIYAGAIEESPGKEPSPKFLVSLVNDIKSSGAKAIFSEPQLNIKTAEVIAKEAGVKVFELNPEGNSNTMKNYKDLLLHNVKIIQKALE